MPDPYIHDSKKFADAGLQLRTPVDLVPPLQYSRLSNVIPVIEGQLETRPGLTLLATVLANTPVHTIFRLNQEVTSIVGDRIVGLGSRLFTAPLPLGDVFVERTGFSFSGAPLSLVSFRFDLDQAAWAIIADQDGMRKYRGGVGSPGFYYQKLGLTPPDTVATGSDGGAGNLNSTGGIEFDWRYTYVNRVTGSESNPSPIKMAASDDVKRPTVSTNPDGGFGGGAFTNPGNAIDTDSATYASGSADSATETRRSCRWGTWSAAGGTPETLNLYVDAEVIVAGTSGVVVTTVYYSLDGGTTWKTVFTTGGTQARNVYTVTIPAGTAYSQLAVRAVVFGSGVTAISDLAVRRLLYQHGGEFPDPDLYDDGLLIGGGGDRTLELRVYDIRVAAQLILGTTSTLALVNRKALVCVKSPSDTQVTHIRLYRRGGSLTTHKRVGEYAISDLAIGGCSAGSLEITDNIPDSSLGSTLELDNDVPITSVERLERPLPYIWGPFDERVLGCGDPDRPESIYFSKRGNADQWPPQNHVEVSSPGEPIVNGAVFNTRTFAFSHERMYELVPNLIGGVTLTPYPTPCARGLISPWGVCVAEAIYFVAKDGIYRTTGGSEQSIVENDIKPLFPTLDAPGRAVNGYAAVDMTFVEDIRLSYHNDEVRFTYRGVSPTTLQTLIYDIRRGRWRAATYTPSATLFHGESSTQSSLLVGSTDGKLLVTASGDDAGSNIAASLRTGAYDQGVPLNLKQYGNVIFDLDPGGATVTLPVTITPYINGEAAAQAALTVTGSGRQRVALSLSDVFAYNLSFDIAWTRTASINPKLFQLDILFRPEPTSVRHWESRETSHGLLGYQHVRDMYVCLRSTSNVTLTVTVDGVATTYSIASTSGERRKVYVPLKPNKGKLFLYAMDASADFQTYESDTEVRVKPWLTNLGYATTRPFGQETG